MITLDDRHIRAFERELKTYTKNAILFANRSALNKGASLTKRHAEQRLAKQLTLRNKFTLGSLQVQRAFQKRIQDQEAIMGSISPYLKEIEFGGTIKSKGKRGVPIPSRSAAGEGRGSIRSKRLVRPINTRRRIKLRRTRGFKKRQKNVLAFEEAVASGRKFVFMDTAKGGPGIFKLLGGKRKPKAELMWSLKRKSVPIKSRPWLQPTTVFVAKKMPEIYREELRRQVIRHGLFKTKR